jgi:hypothetical protein
VKLVLQRRLDVLNSASVVEWRTLYAGQSGLSAFLMTIYFKEIWQVIKIVGLENSFIFIRKISVTKAEISISFSAVSCGQRSKFGNVVWNPGPEDGYPNQVVLGLISFCRKIPQQAPKLWHRRLLPYTFPILVRFLSFHSNPCIRK